MANVTVKAPAGTPQGSQLSSQTGTLYTVGAGGLTVIASSDQEAALKAGFSLPSNFSGAVAANLTANTTGTQAGATALSYGINQIATAGAAASAAALPAAVPGTSVTVINDTANTTQIFGTGSDTINGVTATVGITQPANSELTYYCAVAGQWRVTPGVGFSGALETNLPAGPISANATGTQAGATPLTGMINSVNVSGAANSAVLLPVSAPGMQLIVGNIAANAVNVFPQVNEKINSVAANGALSVAAGKSAMFVCAAAGQWHGILSA